MPKELNAMERMLTLGIIVVDGEEYWKLDDERVALNASEEPNALKRLKEVQERLTWLLSELQSLMPKTFFDRFTVGEHSDDFYEELADALAA